MLIHHGILVSYLRIIWNKKATEISSTWQVSPAIGVCQAKTSGTEFGKAETICCHDFVCCKFSLILEDHTGSRA